MEGVWKGTGKDSWIVVGFTAKNPIYTINATAGKNGKIDPAGDIAVNWARARNLNLHRPRAIV